VTFGKNFKINERMQFDLLTLVSNIFNHPNFNAPAADISTADAAVITSAQNLWVWERGGPRVIEFRARLRF
jgi:hypothetical protein